jgi:hypothetical protein
MRKDHTTIAGQDRGRRDIQWLLLEDAQTDIGYKRRIYARVLAEEVARYGHYRQSDNPAGSIANIKP